MKFSNFASNENVESKKIGHVIASLNRCSVSKLREEKLFISGGDTKTGDPALDTVIEYDLIQNISRQAPTMRKARERHNSCVLDENLYVFGGEDKYKGTPIPSIEVLDLLLM